MSKIWDQQKNVDTLRRLNAEGKSAAEIAKEIGQGLTRNAVIGKISRLGIGKNKPAPGRVYKKKTKPLPRQTMNDGAGVSFMTCLAVDGCRFHSGIYSLDHGWCGASRLPGKLWCAHHELWLYDTEASARRIRVPTERVILVEEPF